MKIRNDIKNEKLFSTGEFASIAQVTKRTLQFYDRKGLLKPSYILDNGYRKYTLKDLERLQKILMFKELGFSLDEITMLLLDSRKDLLNSIRIQKDLVNDKINHLKNVHESLGLASLKLESGNSDSEDVILNLIQVLKKDENLVEQYKTANNLRIRTNLHQKYSTAKVPWFEWLFSQLRFDHVNRILEIGCGNGLLWKKCSRSMRNRDIFLSDISEGMVDEARKQLNTYDYSFMVFAAESIPFKNSYFDAVIANHMLFYLKDFSQGMKEINRVLCDHGTLYASAYGKNHMKEVTELVKEFDPQIYLSDENLFDRFGKENGKELLSTWFNEIVYIPYEDHLEVTDSRDLADYIISCHGNQNERLRGRIDEFLEFLDCKMKQMGKIVITKDAGLFIAKK